METERIDKSTGKVRTENRYYISSLEPEVKRHNEVIRQHWCIENNLHWSLDVTFREDDSRIQKGYAGENVAWLRKMALSLLKRETTFKGSLKRKQFKALMDTNYLAIV